MSYPRHPKGEAIRRMLMEMRSHKTISLELRVPVEVVRNQADRLGILRVGLTKEERLWLADKRGIDRRLVP